MNEIQSTRMSRLQFLGASALGATSLGLPGQESRGGEPSSQARRGFVVAVTHGHNNPARVMLALFTATRLPPGENHLWFAIDGGELCKKGEAEKVTSPLFVKQGSAAKLIEQSVQKGTALHI